MRTHHATAPAAAPLFEAMRALDPQQEAMPPAKPRQPRAVPAHEVALCVLGSGSGGNSTLLRRGDDLLLIDAGFGPRTTFERMMQAGVDFASVRGVLLTHLDRDHFRPSWVRTLLTWRTPVFCHRWHADELAGHPKLAPLHAAGLVRPFGASPFEPMRGVRASALMMQHDRQGTAAFRLEADGAGGRRIGIGYATDLGHAPRGLIQHLAGVDLLCIEANYDVHMTKTCARPTFVNRRNLSDSGHLSNEQSLEACRQIDAASPHANPRKFVLLHRSSQCNHPTKVRRVFEAEPALRGRVRLTEQRRRSAWLRVKPQKAVVRGQLSLRSAG